MKLAVVFVIALCACGKSDTDREIDDLINSVTTYRTAMCKCTDLDCVAKNAEGLAIVTGSFGRLDQAKVPKAKADAFAAQYKAASDCENAVRTKSAEPPAAPAGSGSATP